MLFTNLFILSKLFGFVYGMIMTAAILTLLWAIVCTVCGSIARVENNFWFDNDEVGEWWKKKKIKSKWAIAAILIVIASLMPAKSDVIKYYAIRQLDNHNIENIEDTLTPERTLKLLDDAMDRVEKFLNSEDE